ncbi:MAG: hypothetical protein KDA75_17450, partial [Planctomycetaceae bacterium]|nr:hypothetical protein [Planctomycetaceae bacterium]
MSRRCQKLGATRWVVRRLITGLALIAMMNRGDAQLVHRHSATTPNGDNIGSPSSQFADVQIPSEESIVLLNDDFVRVMSPGDGGILQIFDQDSFDIGTDAEFYRFDNNILYFSARSGDSSTRRIYNENDTNLEVRTDGQFFNIYTDVDNDTGSTEVGRWFNNGTALSARIFQIDDGGHVEIKGSLTQNVAFDLAESFLKTEVIEPGQLIAVAASRHDGVRLTTGVHDRAVIGVASTKPGVILGGGAFGVDQIEANWGAEHVTRFRAEQSTLQERALAERE